MQKLRLTRGLLIGDRWRNEGDLVDAQPKQAEALVRSGAAVPVEQAVLPAQHVEQAVAKRQAAK